MNLARTALCGLWLVGCASKIDTFPPAGIESDGGVHWVADSGVVESDDSGTEAMPLDAGTSDAGATGDAGFYGAVRCPNAAYYVCDDFENGFDANVWLVEKAGGDLVSDATKVARGTKSLRATITPAGSKALLKAKTIYPMGNGHLWGRMFAYIPASASNSLTAHSNLVTVYGNNSTGGGAVYGAAIGSKNFFGLFYQVSPFIDEASFQYHPNTPFTAVPLDRWFCFEWDFSGLENRLSLYLDGVLIPSSVIAGRPAPATAEVRVGSEFDIAEMWMDSVALAANRIGCSQ